jgi:hypothetical protein
MKLSCGEHLFFKNSSLQLEIFKCRKKFFSKWLHKLDNTSKVCSRWLINAGGFGGRSLPPPPPFENNFSIFSRKTERKNEFTLPLQASKSDFYLKSPPPPPLKNPKSAAAYKRKSDMFVQMCCMQCN